MRRLLHLCLLAIIVIGIHPLRRKLISDLEKNAPHSIKETSSLGLDQMSTTIALGGLRSLVACQLNLQAFGAFEENQWERLEKLYHTITALDPQNTSYWSTGAWHLTHNAYYDFEEKLGLAPARRRFMQRRFYEKGVAMLLTGTTEARSPERLWVQLARLHSDKHRSHDFEAAALFYENALKLAPESEQLKREYFYTLAQTKRTEEAWQLGATLLSDRRNHKYPGLRTRFYLVSLARNPELSRDRNFLLKCFNSHLPTAYKRLVQAKTQMEKESLPLGSLATVIKNIELELPH